MFSLKKLFFVLFSLANVVNAEQILVSNFNESEYESVERVFANNTGYIDHLVDFIDMNFISEGSPKESFLDIGPGPATVTDRLSKFFRSTTVIDPNKSFAPIYKEKGFNMYIDNFQNVDINTQFDLILCSHVLYHVPQEQWNSFLRKLNRLLNSQGKALVVLVAPKGKSHALRSSINSDYSNSEKVEKALKELNISYELILVQSIFKVSSYDDFRALVRLFTIDDCYLPQNYLILSDQEKKLIDQKIDNYILTCKLPDGSYEFIEEDVYILIDKKSCRKFSNFVSVTKDRETSHLVLSLMNERALKFS